MASVKSIFDKATYPFVFGGLALIPFIGASTNVALAANPNATPLDVGAAFYQGVTQDPTGSILGAGKFVSMAATSVTGLGETVLSGAGINAGIGTVATLFNFATGAAIVTGGIYLAYRAMAAILEPKAA